jgi:peptidoglycan/xylan/chitin deacetylase (PgdA/CDA1 family)
VKYLVITVDTEADWFDKQLNAIKSIGGLDFLQEKCQKYDMKPTYLVSYEMATREEAIKVIKEYLDSGQCEVGNHLHVWSTPPFESENSYGVDEKWIGGIQSEMEASVFEAKMKTLDDAILENYCVKPTSHRAGRWAIDKRTLNYLAKNGYLVDSSICPYVSWTQTRGVNDYIKTDSFNAPNIPYYPDTEDITKSGENSGNIIDILEVPVTGIKGDRLGNLKVRGIRKFISLLYKFGYNDGLKNMSFRPSYSFIPYKVFQNLTHSIIKSSLPVINMAFHSSELTLGTSPYSKDKALLETLKNKVEYVIKTAHEYGMKGICLSEVPKYIY